MAISLQQTPPGDTRWEARWGHYKHPHQRQAQRQEAHINFFGCSPRGRSDTSLIDPPTYSGQKFRQQTQKWRFYPWRHPVYYGICQFTYKPIHFSPYKKTAKVSPKHFSGKIPSPQTTNCPEATNCPQTSDCPSQPARRDQVRQPPTVYSPPRPPRPRPSP
jgi:hypothetical protein